MGIFYALTENSSEKAEQMETKLLTSKIESLNNTLSNLLQKKIRIDLEIKRTRKKLSKLKSQGQTKVRTRIELEGFDYDQITETDQIILEKQIGTENYQLLYDLDEQIVRSEFILADSEDLPLAE